MNSERAVNADEERADIESESKPFRPFRSLLSYYLSCYLDVTGHIQRTKNRLVAMNKSTEIGEWPREEERSYLEVYEQQKTRLTNKLLREAKKHPDYKWMSELYGMGPYCLALFLDKVDIEKARTVSSLWRFCGLAVFNGKRQGMVKGQKRDYCSVLKAAVLQHIGQMTLIRCRVEPYYSLYLKSKEYYQGIYPKWTKLHLHLAARRHMAKIYLEHLWRRWRTEHNLPARDIYVIERLGHTTYIPSRDPGADIVPERASVADLI